MISAELFDEFCRWFLYGFLVIPALFHAVKYWVEVITRLCRWWESRSLRYGRGRRLEAEDSL